MLHLERFPGREGCSRTKHHKASTKSRSLCTSRAALTAVWLPAEVKGAPPHLQVCELAPFVTPATVGSNTAILKVVRSRLSRLKKQGFHDIIWMSSPCQFLLIPPLLFCCLASYPIRRCWHSGRKRHTTPSINPSGYVARCQLRFNLAAKKTFCDGRFPG